VTSKESALWVGGAFLALTVISAAQETKRPLFRRVDKPLKTVSLDLQTGTIVRGPVGRSKSFPGSSQTCVSLFNNDFSQFVGVDTGLTGGGPCEWIDTADKGFGRSGGKSGYLTGFTWAYCSAALDPQSGGPGGSTVIGFRSDYTEGTVANANGPTGVLQGSFALSGLPANTNCSSFWGGFSCYLVKASFGNLPLCLPDGPIGWSWRFTDLGTDGTLAKTFPFLSCVQSCSGVGKDQMGMTEGMDKYCPAGGAITQSFSFSTTIPYFTSISIELEEAVAAAASSVVVTETPVETCGANPIILSNTSTGVGSPVNAPILGKNWRVTLNCTSPPATIGKIAILRIGFGPPPSPICTQWGIIRIAISAGTGQNFYVPVPASRLVNLTIPLAKNLGFYQACYRIQGLCPRTSAPGYVSNALLETTGSK